MITSVPGFVKKGFLAILGIGKSRLNKITNQLKNHNIAERDKRGGYRISLIKEDCIQKVI